MTIGIPNILTIIRILLAPVFVIFLLREFFVPALIVFTVAGISDGLDGFIARYFNQKTALGAYLDPIADKMLLISAFVSLGILKIIPAWLAVVVISRDVLIVIGIAVFTITEKSYKVKPSIVSKLTTVSQITAIIVTLMGVNAMGLTGLKTTLFWTTAVLTLISGFHYIYLGMNILQDNSGRV